MENFLAELPFYQLGKERIYVPIFSETINQIYAKDFEKLLIAPYKSLLTNYQSIIIDPFDHYGDDLYGSFFTKLVLIKKEESGSAYYDYDSASLYFVNKQGRLDTRLALFDTGLRNPSHNHMVTRLTPVAEAYFANDKELFESLLVENKLVSSKLIYSIRTKRISRNSGEGR